MAYSDARSHTRPETLLLVGAVHLALGFALVTGLAGRFVSQPDVGLEATQIDAEVPPPPPPDPVELRVETPTPPLNAPRPLVDLPPEPPTMPLTDVITPPQPPLPPQGPPILLEPAPPLPPAAPPGTPAAARGDPRQWITDADYPTVARRDGLTGTSRIRWEITAAGRVENCTVVASSGHPALDRAACDAVQRRGRYQPARDASGTAVRSSSGRSVVWTLPQD